MRRHHPRGQALVEAALGLPIIVTLAFVTFDLGRIVADQGIVINEVNVGITKAVASQNGDVGTVIRNESNSAIVTATQWGNGNSGSANDCQGTHPCGDNNTNNPCASGSAWWTAGVTGCYSVGTCTITTGAISTCGSYAWGLTSSTGASPRPVAGAGNSIAVRVVLRFPVVTPFLTRLQPSGYVYVTKTIIGRQVY